MNSLIHNLSLQLLDALENDDEAKASSLIKQGADVNFIDPATGNGCFIFAVDNPNLVTLLLSNGADPNLRDGGGDRPLFHAINLGNVDVVRALVDSGADVNLRTGVGSDTFLNVAFMTDQTDVLKYLIQKGANPDLRSDIGNRNLWDLARAEGISKKELAETIA